jgi:hypothetical protein
LFAGQKIDCLGESPLCVVFKFKLWLAKFISVANCGRLTSRAAAVPADKIESDGTHCSVKQRTILDLVVAAPELDESFLDNVFRISR